VVSDKQEEEVILALSLSPPADVPLTPKVSTIEASAHAHRSEMLVASLLLNVLLSLGLAVGVGAAFATRPTDLVTLVAPPPPSPPFPSTPAYPSPPSQPPPPPASPPLALSVTQTFTLDTTVDIFDSRAFGAALAVAAGVNASMVQLSVRPGSVVVEAVIRAMQYSELQSVHQKLTNLTALDAAGATAQLGVAVLSIEPPQQQIVLRVPPSSPPSSPPEPPPVAASPAPLARPGCDDLNASLGAAIVGLRAERAALLLALQMKLNSSDAATAALTASNAALAAEKGALVQALQLQLQSSSAESAALKGEVAGLRLQVATTQSIVDALAAGHAVDAKENAALMQGLALTLNASEAVKAQLAAELASGGDNASATTAPTATPMPSTPAPTTAPTPSPTAAPTAETTGA